MVRRGPCCKTALHLQANASAINVISKAPVSRRCKACSPISRLGSISYDLRNEPGLEMVLQGFQTLFVFCMCYAVVSDFRELLIPNWIVITLLVAFLVFGVIYLEPLAILWHFLIALVVLVFTTVFFALNWIGGGD